MPLAKYRHYGCRITDELLYKGYRTIILENDVLRVGILLDKGADIFQFLYKPADVDFLWRSPQGLIDPRRFTATRSASAGSFLDSYHGGWQEILPGGGPVDYRGAELGLHGEVTHLGWNCDILKDMEEEISVRLTVDCLRTPLRLEKILTLKLGVPSLFIDEKVTNLSSEDQELMWGHHPSFGAPFLHKGVRLFIPAEKGEIQSPKFLPCSIFKPGNEFVWPTAHCESGEVDLSVIPGEEAGYADLIYLKELQESWYAVLDTEKKVGFGLAWTKDVFPYLWFWLVYGKAPGYPWWDRVYCIALEPWSSIPNSLAKAIEANTQIRLKGGETLEASLCATAITGKESVKRIQLDGTVL